MSTAPPHPRVTAATQRRAFRLPIAAPVLCDDAAALNPAPPRDRLGLCRRMLAVLRRRCRRAVRAALRCRRPLHRGRPGWHVVTSPPRLACCALVGCRYHLAEFYRAQPLAETCAVMVANAGPHRLEEVAAILGCTRQNVEQIEHAALAKPKLRAMADKPAAVASLEERVREALRHGERGIPELVRRFRVKDETVLAVLEAMVAAGEVVMRRGALTVGRRWRLVGTSEGSES